MHAGDLLLREQMVCLRAVRVHVCHIHAQMTLSAGCLLLSLLQQLLSQFACACLQLELLI